MITRNLNLFSHHVNALKGLFQFGVKFQGNRLMRFCLLIALAVTVSVMAKAQSSNSTGSVLIFPYYDSGANPAQKNTQFTIVNTSNASVRALLIMHAQATAPSYAIGVVCIKDNGVFQFDTYTYDPFNKGTLYVIAVDSSGVPTQANVLTGLAQIKRASIATNNAMNISVPAYAVKKLSAGSTGIVINNGVADLTYDGTTYEQLPNAVIGETLVKPGTSGPFVTLAPITANLQNGAGAPGTVGITSTAYRTDQNNPYSTVGSTSFTGISDLLVTAATGLRIVSPTSYITFTNAMFIPNGYLKIACNANQPPALGIYYHEDATGKIATLMKAVGFQSTFTMNVTITTPPC